jgi:uncharacterized protein YacL
MIDIIQIVLLVALIFAVLTDYRPKKKTMGTNNSRTVVLDTCALIDGRIVELARSGFVPEKLVVPEFILRELQLLADGRDSHKRDRARFGLDVVKELQANKYSTIIINRNNVNEEAKTDDKLLKLTKKLGAELYTTDYNLAKLAEIEGVRVLNVNELAQELRPIALPGEKLQVKIVQKGSNPKQGVGYLKDGTMIVIDNAARFKNKIVSAEVTRVHQTVAGKMIFANLTR